jgi:hypothetical protein
LGPTGGGHGRDEERIEAGRNERLQILAGFAGDDGCPSRPRKMNWIGQDRTAGCGCSRDSPSDPAPVAVGTAGVAISRANLLASGRSRSARPTGAHGL